MASITIRNLDSTTKQALRERAAAHGRSMEEEVRLLLTKDLSEKTGGGAENSEPILMASEIGRVERPIINKPVLLIISGGIAAYKSLELIRLLRKHNLSVRVVLTKAACEFVTETSVGALSGSKVFTDLFDFGSSSNIDHIRLAREAEMIVIAPTTADLMAKMAGGHADDLATAIMLATRVPILLAPAMNPAMWTHAATLANVKQLQQRGALFIGPVEGEMAEANESGIGRMADPQHIAETIFKLLDKKPKLLSGKRVLVTSGPTHEPIDPVRYLANRSSGKQGHAIARALAEAGAQVILISGPVHIPDPPACTTLHLGTAQEMEQAVRNALPVDVAIMVAAVADWRIDGKYREKIKKNNEKNAPSLNLIENPDILKMLADHDQRPHLLVGFAAETQNLLYNGTDKLKRKGADWIIANNVSPKIGVMGGENNKIQLITNFSIETWPMLTKQQVAERLVAKIATFLVAPLPPKK